MSGRGGGRNGGRGRFGRGGGAPGPVAKDEDGTVIGTEIAGPPPLFPETLLPPFPDITERQQELLSRRTTLTQVSKRTPFYLEAPKDTLKATDIDARISQWAQTPVTKEGSNPSAGGVGLGIRKLRQRAPLFSAMRLLPEYFPEELFGSSAKRAGRLQEAYWKSAGKKQDPTGFLTELLQRESKEGEGGRAQGQEEGEEVEEDMARDTDDEEDMEDDDYYKGADFDDDEGYDDDFGNGGGDDGALY